jgi:type I restriction enzyme M protein
MGVSDEETIAACAQAVWALGDLLRGELRADEYHRVMLPLVALKRLEQAGATKGWSASSLISSPRGAAQSIGASVPTELAELLDSLDFGRSIDRLGGTVKMRLADAIGTLDLGPSRLSNTAASELFELVAQQLSVEEGGEHWTPPDVTRLVARLVHAGDAAKRDGVVVYDPACGLGGSLFQFDEPDQEGRRVTLYGQDVNQATLGLCKLRALMAGQDSRRFQLGNTLVEDRLGDVKADYIVSCPPFGLSWQRDLDPVRAEHQSKGHAGRFGPGLPRVSDGSLLFLLHMLSKAKPQDEGGARIAFISSGSPLWAGGAGSGESEIRRYLFEKDWIDAIIALPSGLYPNTGIPTYLWILSNTKTAERQRRVRVLDASDVFEPVRRREGLRRHWMSPANIARVVEMYRGLEDGPLARSFDTAEFGFRALTIERPLRLSFRVSEDGLGKLQEHSKWQKLLSSRPSEGEPIVRALRTLTMAAGWSSRDQWRNAFKEALIAESAVVSAPIAQLIESLVATTDRAASVCMSDDGPEADPALRNRVDIALGEGVDEYLAREVLPSKPDAWVSDAQVGYAIRRIAHLGFALSRELSEIKEEYQHCELLLMSDVCGQIVRETSQKGDTKTDANALVRQFKRFGIRAEPDSERVLPDYLAMFFATDLGARLLSALSVGSVVAQIDPEDLGNLRVPVPTLDEQRGLLTAKGRLEELAAILKRIETELAANPRNLAQVNATIIPVQRVLGQLSDADEVRERIRAGESKRVEFKQTFSVDVAKQTREKYIEESALKTVVAFLNSDGGDLLLGVHDDGTVVGLNSEIDVHHKSNRDKFLLHVKNAFASRIGAPSFPLIDQRVVDLQGKVVLWIRCDPSKVPAFLDEEKFFVRTNPATDLLTGRKMADYITARFQ